MDHIYDVAVIGAGPGGSTSAYYLAKHGLDVLLLDRAEFPRDKTCGDALSPLAVDKLAELGFLDRLLAEGAHKISRVGVRGISGEWIETSLKSFLKTEYKHGLVMPRIKLDLLLRDFAKSTGLSHIENANVVDFQRSGDHVETVRVSTLDGELFVHARYFVIAVGANIGLLRKNGFIRSEIDIALASRGYFEAELTRPDSYDFFYEKELLPGYGWVFPTGPSSANIGAGTWGDSKVTAKELMAFVARLEASGVITNPHLLGEIKGFPLRIDFPSQRVAGDNWMLVGESAGLVNPLTGEGIDLAIDSGLIAAEVLVDAGKNLEGHPAHVYTERLNERYRTLFGGMNLVRKLVVNSFALDRVIRTMKTDMELFHVFLSVAMGLRPAWDIVSGKLLWGLLRNA